MINAKTVSRAPAQTRALQLKSTCCCEEESYGLFDYMQNYRESDIDRIKLAGCMDVLQEENSVIGVPVSGNGGLLSIAAIRDSHYCYHGRSGQIQLGGNTQKRDDFFISEQLKEYAQLAYKVVASCKITKKTSGVEVRRGDILKFGRVPYLVKETSSLLDSIDPETILSQVEESILRKKYSLNVPYGR